MNDTRIEDKANRFELYNVKETAEILKVSRMTVYALIKGDKLKAKKLGRAYIIQGKEIRRCLDEQNNH